jgi:hypothetical protein
VNLTPFIRESKRVGERGFKSPNNLLLNFLFIYLFIFLTEAGALINKSPKANYNSPKAKAITSPKATSTSPKAEGSDQRYRIPNH